MTTSYLDALVSLVALPDGGATAPPVRAYLASRGLDAVLARNAYRLGYVPAPALDDVYAGVERAGYVVPQEFRHWARYALVDRLLFPLTHPLGFVIGLQTRSLDPSADEKVRYLRFRPRMYRSVYAALFGADIACPAALRSGRIICTEGPIDALAVSLSTPDVVATLTASVSHAQRETLWRWADIVVALFDMDEAGRKAVSLLTAAAPPGVTVTAPTYPLHDPAALHRDLPDVLARVVGQTTVDDVLAILRHV